MNHSKAHLISLALGAALLLPCPLTAASNKPVTTMVSVNSDGVQGNDHSSKFDTPDISGDGRYIAFTAKATNLVENDINGAEDIFVHDSRTGETTRVSVNSNGDQANASSRSPVISSDGRYVAFTSSATNLVADDTNNKEDIFVHDRQTGQTTRVSVSSNGVQGNGISSAAAISADGRYVAFHSLATQLDTTITDTKNFWDIFVHDRQTSTTTLVSRALGGNAMGNETSAHPQISGNGRYVTFYSRATDLTTTDTNTKQDVFIRDLQTQTTSLISATPSGNAGNGVSSNSAISYDGRYVAFDSSSSELVEGDTNSVSDVFLLDRNTNHTTRISGDIKGTLSLGPSISDDGRYISYLLYDDTYVEGIMPIFRHDRVTGKATRVNVNKNGEQENEISEGAVMSADGNYVAFYSWASDLVDGDTNNRSDVFVRGPYLEKFPWAMFLPTLTGGGK